MPGRQFLRYFRFPKNAELSKQWVIRLKRDQWVPFPYSKVCSDHFFDSDFTERSLHKVFSVHSGQRVQLLLEQGAIPNTDPQEGSFREPRVPLRSNRVVREPIITSASRSPSPSDLPENQQLDDNQVESEIDKDRVEPNEDWEDDWVTSSESDGDGEEEWFDTSDDKDAEEDEEWVDVEG